MLENNPKARPFVCEGNPFECEIFIVGFNAATEMKSEFSKFWDDAKGYDKKEWLEEYKNEIPKQRKRKISPTRERINRISEAAKPLLCLETNIYAMPTPKAKDLKQLHKSTALFEFLLQEIKPRVVFVHGVKAIRFMEGLTSSILNSNKENIVELFGNGTYIITGSHLSRGWSYERAKTLGTQIKEVVKENG